MASHSSEPSYEPNSYQEVVYRRRYDPLFGWRSFHLARTGNGRMMGCAIQKWAPRLRQRWTGALPKPLRVSSEPTRSQAIAASVKSSPLSERTTTKFWTGLDCMRTQELVGYPYVPTQEGERCYFCQDPAEFFYRRLLWCHGCAKNVKGFICREPILGKNPKTIPTFHQWSELFPWGKLVLILLTGQDGINVYADLPWTLVLWILFHGKEVRMKALARKEALARMEAIFHK